MAAARSGVSRGRCASHWSAGCFRCCRLPPGPFATGAPSTSFSRLPPVPPPIPENQRHWDFNAGQKRGWPTLPPPTKSIGMCPGMTSTSTRCRRAPWIRRPMRANARPGLAVQRRRCAHAAHRCRLCRAGRGAHPRSSLSLLCDAAPVAPGGYVASPPGGNAQYRTALVAVSSAPCGNPDFLCLRRAEPALFGSGPDRSLLLAAICHRHGGLCCAAQLLLLTLEAPEPRYTLECFPIVIAFAAVALDRFREQD